MSTRRITIWYNTRCPICDAGHRLATQQAARNGPRRPHLIRHIDNMDPRRAGRWRFAQRRAPPPDAD